MEIKTDENNQLRTGTNNVSPLASVNDYSLRVIFEHLMPDKNGRPDHDRVISTIDNTR